jgi:Domain of unknown function (DUF4395)
MSLSSKVDQYYEDYVGARLPIRESDPTAAHRFGAGLFSFPDPVNEISARLVAGGVVLLSLATIVFDQPWMTALIAYGFLARVASGPTLSPLGQLVTRVITPRLHVAERPVPGPPKRFAQGIGAVFSVSAAVLALGFDLNTAAYIVLGLLIVAATLESVFGVCLGCRAFAALMRLGVIPAEICERCNNLAVDSVSGVN